MKILLPALTALSLVPEITRAGEHSMSYDSLNRISQITYANGSRIEYTYDAAGNRSTYLAVAPGTTESEVHSFENGDTPTLTLNHPGGAGATYDWYRNGVKISTTSVPELALGSFSADGAGSYRVIVRETSGVVSVIELAVKLTGLTYESWLQHKEGPAATPADPELAKLASARNDGLENILKYAFGKGPNELAHYVLPTASWTGTGSERRLAITFRRIFNPLDIDIKVDASGDLAAWRDVTGELVPVGDPVIAPDGLTEEVTLQAPVAINHPDAANWKFLRIAVRDPNQTAAILLQDDFNDGVLDSTKWNAFGNTVQEQDGHLKLLTNQTDAGGKVLSKQFPMPADGLTITRKARVHYSNNYSIPSIKIGFFDALNQETWVFSASYGNMSYDAGVQHSVHGTFLGLGQGNPHDDNLRHLTVEGPPVLWDQWFEEKITYDRPTGLVRYYRNGVQEISGVAPIKETGSPVFLKMDGWGWFTGHWHHCDDLLIKSGVEP